MLRIGGLDLLGEYEMLLISLCPQSTGGMFPHANVRHSSPILIATFTGRPALFDGGAGSEPRSRRWL
jgi:hypothetical protein